MPFRFDNSYARDLTGFYLRQMPDRAPNPRLLGLNEALAAELGLDIDLLRDHGGEWFSGASVPSGADPIALAYAGHQFGGFSAQLGDGRAHLLGEHLGPDGRRWDLQLKGSGRTPFSRGGDGKAAVGPMLREYVISEAMAALGIPTTRVLGVASTGETIMRDQGPVPGAVVARIAASHIRVGTFQFFAARGEDDKLKQLLDYTIDRHFPDAAKAEVPALALWDAVMRRQVSLIAEWMGVGFVHGVMNTDNMALSGETIDYGPCAFIDTYEPGAVFSSIDRQGRYAFANQPVILGWNLARFAESMLGLIDPDQNRAVDLANQALDTIQSAYDEAWLNVMRRKLGLLGTQMDDVGLVQDLLSLMQDQAVDWTCTLQALAGAVTEDHTLLNLFAQQDPMKHWLVRWRARLAPDAIDRLRRANPAVIPRNHLVEEALRAATLGDMSPFERLLAQVRDPFGATAGREAYCLPAPSGFGPYVTYCGT
jgi:uncharacterized protein YdiU (UPF0061 family)